MKQYIFLIIFCLCACESIAQQSIIDSLLLQVKEKEADTSLVTLYGKLAQEYIKIGDSATAYRHAYHSYSLAENTKLPYFIASAHSDIGFCHLKLGYLDSVKYHYNEVLHLIEDDTTTQSMHLKVIANNNLAFAFSLENNMPKALSLVIDNLPIIKRLGDLTKYKTSVHNISAAFTTLGELEKAYPYMREDMGLADTGSFPTESNVETYLSSALLYFFMDSLHASNATLSKAKSELDKLEANSYLWGRYYSLGARLMVKMGDKKAARSFLEKAKAHAKNVQNATNLIDLYSAELRVEWSSGNLKNARDVGLKMLTLSKDERDRHFAATLKDVSLIYQDLGNYPLAFKYLMAYSDLNDSLIMQQNALRLHDLEMQYQTAEKEKQILQLQAEQKEARLTQSNQRLLNWLLGVGAVVFLTAFVFAIYIYKERQKKIARELNHIEQERQLEVTKAVLDGEERERRRIARDLHDGLGGALSGIKIKLSNQEHTVPVIDETIIQLEQSIGELRRIARNMMPETLIRSGLEVALRDLSVSMSSHKTRVELQTNNIQKDLSVQSQVNIYRIVQELLTNAIKHADPSNVLIQCIQENQKFLITVEDDGIGLNKDHITNSKGIGFSNIRNRVELMKGHMSIDSTNNCGTTIDIELLL